MSVNERTFGRCKVARFNFQLNARFQLISVHWNVTPFWFFFVSLQAEMFDLRAADKNVALSECRSDKVHWQNKLKSNKNISAYYSVYKVPSSQRGTIQHLTIEKDCRNNKRQIDFRSSTEKIKSTKGNGTKEEDWMGPFFFSTVTCFS